MAEGDGISYENQLFVIYWVTCHYHGLTFILSKLLVDLKNKTKSCRFVYKMNCDRGSDFLLAVINKREEDLKEELCYHGDALRIGTHPSHEMKCSSLCFTIVQLENQKGRTWTSDTLYLYHY